MRAGKLLVLWLDAYERSVADRLMLDGRLPNLARLKASSSRFLLDYGPQKYTGLFGEHFATGMAPEVCDRWSVVEFNPRTYQVIQRAALFEPLLSQVSSDAVVFDLPYFHMRKAPHVRGVVNWGAHDPGIAAMSEPRDLRDEITAKFGPYPATDYIYAFDWPNAAKTQAAADALVAGLEQRTRIARWLFCERFSDWDLALVVVSELHSAIESMWHGWDPSHPLHAHQSAKPARLGLERIYEAVDRFVGTLIESIPDAAVLVFSMYGMGTNNEDVPSMLLLPELLYRLQFGRSLYEPRTLWRDAASLPLLDETEHWDWAVRCCLNAPQRTTIDKIRCAVRQASSWLTAKLSSLDDSQTNDEGRFDQSLDWMAATRYQPYWHNMRAFALPGFLNGRIRVNLAGREHHGMVKLSDYHDVCGEIEDILLTCRDPRTGSLMVQSVEKCCPDNPLDVDASNADLNVYWQGSSLALTHKDFGVIGPAPFRRTGGHTGGGHGICYVSAHDTKPGDYGIRSSFDVAPTILQMLGQPIPKNVCGRSLFV